MYKCLSAHALGLSSDESELIELALSFGFRALELDVVDFAERVQTSGIDYVRRRLNSAKLKVPVFHLPIDWRNDDDAFRASLEKVPQWAPTAAEMECRLALTWVEPASDDRPYHENFEWHRKRFSEMGKVLAGHGMRLGVGFSAAVDRRAESHFEFIRDFDALNLLVSSVGAKNVGVVVNLWDLWASAGDIQKLRKLSRDNIVAVQVADAAEGAQPLEANSNQRVLPGQTGTIDLPAALTLLAEMDYRGPVIPVPHRDCFEGKGRDAIVQSVGEALDGVWKAAHLTASGKLAQPSS